MGEDWINGRILYYTSVRKYLNGGYIYIWGAGKRGSLAYEILKRICPGSHVVAFIDSYKEGNCCGLPILKIDEVSFDKEAFYCISFAEENSIAIQYLEDKGLSLYQQIWQVP